MNDLQSSKAQKVKQRNKVRLRTRHGKDDVECIDDLPEGMSSSDEEKRRVFKYYCPICMRYFNHIFLSNCCKNYICRPCFAWQAEKAIKEENYKILCSYC